MRIFPTLALVCALTVASPGATAAPGDGHGDRSGGAGGHGKVFAPRPSPSDFAGCQTSECITGPTARQLPDDRLLRGRTLDLRKRWKAAPGVTVSSWDERGPRGAVRFRVMRVNYDTPALSVDYLSPGKVRDDATVSQMMSRYPRTVGGVNGDFFDIGGTGAPLGTGLDRQDGLYNGRRDGWNSTFYINRKNVPHVGVLPVTGRIQQKPGVVLPTLNSRIVRPGTIGGYTKRWGSASGYAWTEGQRSNVRMVRIKDGRVVANRATLSHGAKIRGTILVARGAPQAATLASMKVGSRANLSWKVSGRPQTAITGSAFLLRDGKVIPTDDRELHPRTAVGVDHQKKQIIFLVVDGRQSFSRGYTMVELARRLKQLGATEGINLDGGGSSTLVADNPKGNLKVVNSPSDGTQRYVANGLQVHYYPGRARGHGRGHAGRGR